MTRFSARTEAAAVVPASRRDIWDVLVDPVLVAELTPFLHRITVNGDDWRWQMSGLDVLGARVAPAFTERMTFLDPERIEFRHAPPAGSSERSGVEGWYQLDELEAGTHLATSLEITLDLPLPRVSALAVKVAMKGVLGSMGDKFAKNLLDHLGL